MLRLVPVEAIARNVTRLLLRLCLLLHFVLRLHTLQLLWFSNLVVLAKFLENVEVKDNEDSSIVSTSCSYKRSSNAISRHESDNCWDGHTSVL